MEKKATEKKKMTSRVQSVERALKLVDVLAEKGEGMALTSIAKEVDLPKSTVHGLLATLRDYGYIEQSDESGLYRLGARLFELGSRVARSWDIRDAARPAMKRLSKEFGETVHLGAEDNGEILYLEKMDADSLVSILSDVGVRLPMHCSGLGKVLLAQKSKTELKRLISQRGLPALTKRTITSQAKLERELLQIREQGYAIDDGEIMDGLRCVAAPVEDMYGRVRYAISISGQVRDMYGKRLDRIIEEVKRAAREISYAMSSRRA